MADVVTWNESEANLSKEATTFNDFTYDTQTDSGILNKLDEVKQIMDNIQGDIEDIASKYSELQAIYNTFTSFNENMDDNKNKLQMSIDSIRMSYNSLVDNMDTQISELQKNDEDLMEDLENINELMADTENSEETPTDNTTPNEQTDSSQQEQTKEDTTKDQQKEETTKDQQKDETKKEETPQEQPKEDNTKNDNKTTDGQDLNQVVNDVINGKYGSGDKRKEALEKAGYDSSQVQQLVNEKLTGKKSSTTPTSGSTGTAAPTSGTSAPSTGTTTPTDNSTSAGFMSGLGSGLGSALVDAASNYMGTKYVYGGLSTSGIDCSGLVVQAGKALGLNLPHSTGALASLGSKVDASQAQVGDLIFTNGGKHVVICTGRDASGNLTAISASSKAGQVKNVTVNKGIVQIRRIV